MLVEGDEWAHVEALDPDAGYWARRFAQLVDWRARGEKAVIEAVVPSAAELAEQLKEIARLTVCGFEETIYGLEGVTTWTIDGETVEMRPGDAVCIARGQIHGFENHDSADAKFLAIATPAAFGSAYFREIGEVFAATAGGPPDLAAIGDVMRRHGLTPAPPGAA